MKNIKYYLCAISVLCIVIFLSGCASQDIDSLPTETHTSEMIPAGEFSALPFKIQNTAWLYADQADLYYQEVQWDDTRKILLNRILKWNMESDQSELLFENTNPDNTIYVVFADDSGSLFLFGSLTESGIVHYYLKKIGTDGSELWQVRMDYDTMGVLEGQNIQGGVVDGKGQICLYNRSGNLFFFNEKGECKSKLDTQAGSLEGMVCTGKGSVIGYLFEREPNEVYESLVIFAVDLETGGIGTKETYAVDGGFDTRNVWGGPEDQIVAIADNSLCELDLTGGELRKILSFDGEFINIDGSQIQAVTVLKDGRQMVYLYDGLDQVSEYALITHYDEDTLQVKETITIGTTETFDVKRLEYYVRRFNRKSKHWRVEVVDYFTERYINSDMVDAFSMDVLNGRVPDIIDTRFVPKELLNKEELFENLKPYFESSKIVNQEDLLESVWSAGSINEGMYFVMPWFSMRSSAVKKDKLGESPWNQETLIKLSDTYPDISMLNYIAGDRRLVLLYYVLEANRDIFYDLTSRTCYFMEPQFLSLLEGIKRMQEDGTGLPATNSIEHLRQFVEDELLVYEVKLDNMIDYQRLNKALGDSVSWVGYPSSQECYNVFYTYMMLSINSSSGNKEGAWEFLEFLLSSEAQRWSEREFNAFPVRKDGFDYYIKATPFIGKNWSSEEYATAEEINSLYRMVDNTHLVPFISHDRVNSIIVEESMAYFRGDKSVEETAGTIQNRVKLYLEERKE